MVDREVFGSDGQRSLLRRGRALFDLVSGDPRFSYYGRTVGLLRPEPDGHDDLDRLVELQGASTCANLGTVELGAVRDALAARGHSVTPYTKWTGGGTALDAARGILDRHGLPRDVEVVAIGPETPRERLAALADVALSCGVLPLAGSVLRGGARPCVALLAVDGDGRPVSCAAAAAVAHPDDHELGGQCWWGMLATRDDRRGERLGLVLGAMALREMHVRHGFSDFMTGVQDGNAASEALCRRAGLAPSGRSILTVVGAGALPGGRMTR